MLFIHPRKGLVKVGFFTVKRVPGAKAVVAQV